MTNGTRRGWGVSVTPRPLFTSGKEPVSIVQEAGWYPGPVWTGAENLARTGIRSPDRPARSQSLYRLRYPALFRRPRIQFLARRPSTLFFVLQFNRAGNFRKIRTWLQIWLALYLRHILKFIIHWAFYGSIIHKCSHSVLLLTSFINVQVNNSSNFHPRILCRCVTGNVP